MARGEPAQALPPLPDRRWPISLSGQMPELDDQQLLSLVSKAPVWATLHSNPLVYLFDHAEILLRGRRMFWAALVQANTSLFEPKFIFGAPGEVIHDPTGRADCRQLHEVARLLMQHKDTEPADPTLRRYVEHLKAENTRLFVEDVSSVVLPYPLKESSTFFDQPHLPDSMLSMVTFPVPIDDQCPGAVLPLPESLWPEDLREAWLAADEQRSIRVERRGNN